LCQTTILLPFTRVPHAFLLCRNSHVRAALLLS